MLRRFICICLNLWCLLQNGWRRLLRRRVDYVYLELSGLLPEWSAAPSLLRRLLRTSQPATLQTLRQQLQRIADDPQTRGVVLVLRDFNPGWATVESLRAALQDFRTSGKQVLAYLPGADTRTYTVACAADTILMPPTAYLNLLGLLTEAIFVRDALQMVGLEAEVTAVSPYKSAGDPFTRSDMSPENREQLERLLDERYALLVHAIAADRKLSAEQVHACIDQAPYLAPAAQQAGLIDGLAYEDAIETWLEQHTAAPPASSAAAQPHKLRIYHWKEARRALRLPYRRYQRRYVAVVSIEGAITTSESRTIPLPVPILGGQQVGSDTIARALRQVEQDDRIAALVLHVDSPGGDAFASDLIWREVLRIRQRKPVVASMGNVAASGGYYVAAAANAIVAQPGTITGSIGVLSLRPIATKLLARTGVHAVALSRGAHAGLLSVSQAPTNDERVVFQAIVTEMYATFKERVCSGRALTDAQLEPVAGGRVWTGREAQQLGLIDELGGLPVAIARARTLAQLPADASAPVLWVTADKRREPALPQPFPTEPLAAMPVVLKEVLRPRILAALPWILREP